MGPITIEADNLDKVFFPDAGLTKGDLVDYYRRIGETMLPHVRDRAVSMQRFPDGIDGEGFFQKETPDYFPKWITRKTLPNREGGETTYVVADKAATLIFLADQGTIIPHVWLSRVDKPDHPDRMIFDLDPPDGDDFGPVKDGARRLRDVLDELGVSPFLMTTGSRGLHVVVPLDRSADFDRVRAFAKDVARIAANRSPDRLTTEQRKDKRGGRLFLDVMRNAYAQTGVPPYAVRARASAPVATPIEWDELGGADLAPDRYTITNIFRRLAQKEDPWNGIARHAVSLDEPFLKLRKLIFNQDSADTTG